MPHSLRLPALVLVAASMACGGSGGSDATPSAPTPPTPAVTPTYPVSGTVYLRTDTAAYPPNYSPPTGLVGAQVSLSTAGTQTGANGAYTLRSALTVGVQYLPLKTSLTGYMESWYPWIPPDTVAPIPVGLYPEVAVTRRANFVKGVTFMDGGGNIPGWMLDGQSASTMDRVRNTLGGNLIAYVDVLDITSFNATTNAVTVAPNSAPGDFTVMYPQMVAEARARGLAFMLRVGVGSLIPGTDPGSVPTTNTAFWDAFFASVKPYLVDRATRSRQLNVEYLVLALPNYMLATGSSRMGPLIAAMRSTGYQGKIIPSFAIRSSRPPLGFFAYRFVDAAFWGLVDGIEANFNDGVALASTNEILDRAQPRTRMRAGIKQVLDELLPLQMPIIVHLSTQSVHGGVSNFEYIEPGLGGGSLAPQRTRDYQQQADMYQAAAEVINGTPTGNGRVIGLLSWGYLWNDNRSYFEPYGHDAFDKSSNIRGKPAESVLRWWFQRW